MTADSVRSHRGGAPAQPALSRPHLHETGRRSPNERPLSALVFSSRARPPRGPSARLSTVPDSHKTPSARPHGHAWPSPPRPGGKHRVPGAVRESGVCVGRKYLLSWRGNAQVRKKFPCDAPNGVFEVNRKDAATSVSKTTPCTVAKLHRYNAFRHRPKSQLTRRAKQRHNAIIPKSIEGAGSGFLARPMGRCRPRSPFRRAATEQHRVDAFPHAGAHRFIST